MFSVRSCNAWPGCLYAIIRLLGSLKPVRDFRNKPGGRRFWVSTGVEIWSLVGVCNLSANPPESDLKFQVGGVRQPNLRFAAAKREPLGYRRCRNIADISLFCRCYLALIPAVF